MEFDDLEALRKGHPAWRLLRADNAALVLCFLGRVFVEENVRSISARDLTRRLDDELYALNQQLGEGTFPGPAAAYLADGAAAGAHRSRRSLPQIRRALPVGEQAGLRALPQPRLPALAAGALGHGRRAVGAGSDGPDRLTLRVREAGQFPLRGSRVVIVENEITYLALPPVPDALAILGGGYGITAVAALTWLREREVHYWGDLDTHGFAILDRLRATLPTVRSLLMDRTTLEEHRDHWGHEPTPVNARLEHLTGPEQTLYTDLVEDRYAPALRLEQERIRFGVVRCALEDLE